MTPSRAIPVIDLFAGPGGLGEGFSASGTSARPLFRIALSIEKDPTAHATLTLRSFFRQFANRCVPETYYQHLRGELSREQLYSACPNEAELAANEAWQAELGGENAPPGEVRARIDRALGGAKAWVLIGGPPCQAYSIVGRSRNRGITGYKLEGDERHRLYEEYLRIVADHWPPVFVMENVKGLLSAAIQNELLFERICADLRDPGRQGTQRKKHRYRILSLEESTPRFESDRESVQRFVVRAERHGVPQSRHRVILLGIREDLGDITPNRLRVQELIPVERVLEGLPAVRSGLSQRKPRSADAADSDEAWLDALGAELGQRWIDGNRRIENIEQIRSLLISTIEDLRVPRARRGGEFVPGTVNIDYAPKWYLDARLGGVCNHAARGHMQKDLCRYLFAACYAEVNGRSPRLDDFPAALLPKHQNVPQSLDGGLFNDRFRVQLSTQPATTITSHISKDGHYFIHPDPAQCRSLTVREAARVQTFPDNYFFTGPRTSQYIQVGNAVPPLLAREIAGSVFDVLDRVGLVE